MSRIRRLSVTIETNTANAVRRLKDLDSKVNKLSNSFSNVLKSAEKFGKWGMLRITAPLMAMGGLMINTASWAEEMGAKFNVVFKDMAAASEQWAANMAGAIGRSKYDLMSYLAEMQNLLVGMGMAREEAALFSREIVEMGIDIASFENMADTDALHNMQSALTGIHTAARSLGAVLNENTLALAMQEMGLQGTFQQLDENRKTQVRFRAIVMQSQDAIGNAARETDTFAGRLKSLKGAFKDLSVDLGNELLPRATKVLEWIQKGVDRFRELNPETQQAALAFAGIAAALPIVALYLSVIGTIAKPLIAIFSGIAAVVTGLGAGMALLVAGAIALGSVIQGLLLLTGLDMLTHLKGGESFMGPKLEKAAGYLQGITSKMFPTGMPWQFTGSPALGTMGAPALAGAGGGGIYTGAKPDYTLAPHIEINVTGTDRPRETAQLIRAQVEGVFPDLMDSFFRRLGKRAGD